MAARFLASPAFAPRLPQKRRRLLAALTCLAAFLALAINTAQRPILPDDDAQAAARDMLEGMRELKTLRAELGIFLDPALDIAQSGMVGEEFNDLTTTLGDIQAKRTSLNPQFAALIVMWLKQAGVKPEDRVALCFTGSFPALNLAALYACKAMRLQTVIISSVGASSYGANIPGFTWPDMEKRLYDKGLQPYLSQYLSYGGIVDTEGGLDGTGFALADAAMARHGGIHLVEGGPPHVQRIVERRMEIYSQGGLPKAFINVGGNVTALGWISESALLDNGLLTSIPKSDSPSRGLIFRMFEQGVPVIHMINIERLAAGNHLPIAPASLRADRDYTGAWRHQALLSLAVFLAWLGLGLACLRKFDV